MDRQWPELDYPGWRETCSALHLYLQVAGKYRLAHTPWMNHSWHATFYVTARGWTSSIIPDGPGIDIEFDLIDHRVIGRAGNGRSAAIPLQPMTVASFHQAFIRMIADLGGAPEFHGSPNEVPEPVPFTQDDRSRPYDAEAVTRFFQATRDADRVFKAFRTSFLGKSSPSHLFWGSFDLAVTRFSGRRAPLHPGHVPALPDVVAQEAYDHEVASAGFWPGGGGVDEAAFYAYAYPAPAGYGQAKVEPAEAFWHRDLGEFVLPYDAVRRAPDPDGALMAFLTSTYDAAADLGGWDRASLECAVGAPLHPRPPSPLQAPQKQANSDPTVELEDNGSKGRYVIRVDGHEAEMTYTRAGERLVIIDHTGVPDALRGRRIGQQLVLRAVEDARAGGYTLLPLCPFAKAQIERHPEWQDVVQRPRG